VAFTTSSVLALARSEKISPVALALRLVATLARIFIPERAPPMVSMASMITVSMPSARAPVVTRARVVRRVLSQGGSTRHATTDRQGTHFRLMTSKLQSRPRLSRSSFVTNASGDSGGGAPDLSVSSGDTPAAKRPPKPLDLAIVPRPPLKVAAALAATGCVESSYLAFEKLTNGNVTCPLTGCQTALSSGYSMLFGQPLSAYGAVAYGLVAALCWWGAGLGGDVFGDSESRLTNPSDELNEGTCWRFPNPTTVYSPSPLNSILVTPLVTLLVTVTNPHSPTQD
jgi:hypothetical protein